MPFTSTQFFARHIHFGNGDHYLLLALHHGGGSDTYVLLSCVKYAPARPVLRFTKAPEVRDISDSPGTSYPLLHRRWIDGIIKTNSSICAGGSRPGFSSSFKMSSIVYSPMLSEIYGLRLIFLRTRPGYQLSSDACRSFAWLLPRVGSSQGEQRNVRKLAAPGYAQSCALLECLGAPSSDLLQFCPAFKSARFGHRTPDVLRQRGAEARYIYSKWR